MEEIIKQFMKVLAEVQEAGHGEVNLRIYIKDAKLSSYALNKTTTKLFKQIAT